MIVHVVTTAACLAAMTSVASAFIREHLVVRVYDSAALAPKDRARAIEDAHRILAALDIDVRWHDCDGRAGDMHGWCASPPGPGELVVRLVRAPQREGARAVLGHAAVGAIPGPGSLATVFIDRIESVAGQADTQPWPIAGRVIAHEIGHLLLGSNSHSERGLMRDVWTLEGLARPQPEDSLVSGTERERMRSGLSGLNSLVSTAPRG